MPNVSLALIYEPLGGEGAVSQSLAFECKYEYE